MMPSQTIVVERTIWINAPRDRVWKAVTDASQIRQWWQHDWDIPHLEVGGVVKFGVGDDVIVAKIAACDPPREFAIEWPEHPDYNAIPVTSRFVLTEEDGGTRVTVTESDFGPLPDEIKRKRIEGNLEGYRTVLNDLRRYLEAETTVSVERSVWIDAPIDRAWQAVTDPRDLDRWYATDYRWEIPSLRLGADLVFHNKQDGSEPLHATIDVLDPPREFSLRWQLDATYPEMRQVTRFLLIEENGGTRVTIRETGYEGIPADQRQQYVEMVDAGYLGSMDNLKAYLEGRSLPY